MASKIRTGDFVIRDNPRDGYTDKVFSANPPTFAPKAVGDQKTPKNLAPKKQ